MILINGELANGIQDVADLPVEAVSRVQILPRNVAARVGQSPTRRVINVVIKPDLMQLTLNGKGGLATRGDAFQREGEVNLLKLANLNRRSVVLRAQKADPLFESDRGIAPDTSGLPFDTTGNVVSPVGIAAEIDPALSTLVGMPVTVAGVPLGVGNPSLADFAALANAPNTNGTAAFRTLVSATDTVSANANVTQRFSTATSLSLNGRMEFGHNTGFRGLSSTLLSFPVTSPFSPFSQDVNLAVYLGNPLRSRQESVLLDLTQSLNTQVSGVTINARTNYSRRSAETLSDRSYHFTQLRVLVSTGVLNPFAGINADALGEVRRDRSHSRAENAGFQVTAIGSPFSLPAGPVQLTTAVKGRLDRLSSRTERTFTSAQSYGRDEIGVQGNLQLPILQAAFPDRYIRDATGVLVQIDARPVSFFRDDTEQLRLGATFRRTFGGDVVGEDDDGTAKAGKIANGVRVNFAVSDLVTLSSVRQARASLPEIDLLRGGALGYGGGLNRHVLTFDAGV